MVAVGSVVAAVVGFLALSVVHPNESLWVELEAVVVVHVEPSRLLSIHQISMHATERTIEDGFSLSEEYLNFFVTVNGRIDAKNHSDSSFAIEITLEN